MRKKTHHIYRFTSFVMAMVLLCSLLTVSVGAVTLDGQVLEPATKVMASSLYQPNPECGTYLGVNADGVYEFNDVIPADWKSQPTPLLPGHFYEELEITNGTGRVGRRAQYYYGISPGTAEVKYYVSEDVDGTYELKAIVHITVVSEADYGSSNTGTGAGTSTGTGTGTNTGTNTGTGTTTGTNPDPGTNTGTDKPETYNHQWRYKTQAATCASEGRQWRVCNICGVEETLATKPKTAHTYRSTVTRAATATQEGLRTYTCTYCGDSYTEAIPKLNGGAGTGTSTGTGIDPSTGAACTHNVKITRTERATCTKEGRTYQVCGICGVELGTLSTLPKTEHIWQTKTVAATAAAAGRTYRVCAVCGMEEVLSTTPQLSAEASHNSGSTDMAKLSQQEIIQLLENAPRQLEDNPFDVAPSTTAPYSAGKVKASALQAALNRLNAIRRIAGLPSVSLDTALCENAQYGAVLLAVSDFSHYPAQPSNMSDDFYRLAISATSSSNISAGRNLPGAVDGFMNDSDASNVDRVGHRRWQLNPSMGKVGFGYATSAGSRYGSYVTEKVFDTSGKGCNYSFISWPASGNFPSDLFGGNIAWSVTVNPSQYATPSASNLTVTLTRKSDGKTWTFRGSERYTAASSGKYFNVNAAGYGVSNCIIFRPDGVSAYDGTYSVVIEGLRYQDGSAATLSYEVDFFGAKTDSSQPGQGQNNNTNNNTESNPFTDVPAGSYYHDAVLWALKNGVTTGVTATQFQPNATCSRGQVATFLWRAKGSPEPVTKVNPFSDVSPSSPFYKAILWAYENNITTGTTATTFNPNGKCSSAHVVTFLWRSNNKPSASGSSALANAYPGTYYTDAVAWADSSGLLSGVGAAFSPNQMSPRANIVTYLYRNIAQ